MISLTESEYQKRLRGQKKAPKTAKVKEESSMAIAKTKKGIVELTLPWPPSVNLAYRTWNNKLVKTKVASAYFNQESLLIRSKGIQSFGESRIKVEVKCYPPDKKRRDLDNLGKVLIDTLENSGLFKNDSQIDDLHFIRECVKSPGFVVVRIEEV